MSGEERPKIVTSRAVGAALVLVVILGAYIGAATQMTQMMDNTAVPVAWIVTAVQVLPLSVAGIFPRRVWVLTSAGLLLGSLSAVIQGNESVPWSAMSCVAGLVSLGVMAARQKAVIAWTYGLVGLGIPVAVAAVTVPLPSIGVIIIVSCGVATILIASLYGSWRAARNDLWIERLRAESARNEISLIEERNKIAREIHDVVAHHVSMIAIQAQAAGIRDSGMSPQTYTALANIHRAADIALTEMRTVVDGLRDGGEKAPTRPMSISLNDLIIHTQRAGVDVTLREEGLGSALMAVSEGVSAAIYRIVQESLTNAVRHSNGESVEVHLVRHSNEIRVEVTNRCESKEVGVPVREGKGLLGMRERVRIYGGHFEAGLRADSFVVAATFPLPAEVPGGQG